MIMVSLAMATTVWLSGCLEAGQTAQQCDISEVACRGCTAVFTMLITAAM